MPPGGARRNAGFFTPLTSPSALGTVTVAFTTPSTTRFTALVNQFEVGLGSFGIPTVEAAALAKLASSGYGPWFPCSATGPASQLST